MGRRRQISEGEKFGNLVVLRLCGKTKHGCRIFLCRCVCGTEKQVEISNLISGHTKSCGCLRHPRGANSPSWKGHGGISKDWWGHHVLRGWVGKWYAKEITIDMAYAWDLFLKQGGRCALSGLPIEIYEGGTASIDRIDSSVGYVIGNVQWVHKHINIMKNNHPMDYFVEMCRLVAEFNKPKKE